MVRVAALRLSEWRPAAIFWPYSRFGYPATAADHGLSSPICLSNDLSPPPPPSPIEGLQVRSYRGVTRYNRLSSPAVATMASIFNDFKEGHKGLSGPRLAASLTPVAPPEYPDRLRSFYACSNGANLHSDLRYFLFQANGPKLPRQEQNAWIEIFSAYWKAAGEILKFDDGCGSWVGVFNAWNQVSSVLGRGYTNAGIEAWTIPCLYVVGKYVRTFAIRADAELAFQDSVAFNDRFQDDISFDSEKSAKLEEAARVINKLFTICLNDR